MAGIIVNIVSAALLCIACFLVLISTIRLAKRRFYEPSGEKKTWLIAAACFVGAALLFSPTKSINREVKDALGSVSMAVQRTAYVKEAQVTCQKQKESGDIISNGTYHFTRYGSARTYEMIEKSENWRGENTISLIEKGLKDTGFGRVEEKGANGVIEYRFIKNLKQNFAQKNYALANLTKSLDEKTTVFDNGKAITEAEYTEKGKLNSDVLKKYKSKLAIYEWEETYRVDKQGYLVSWQIYMRVRDIDGATKVLRYVYTVDNLVKEK